MNNSESKTKAVIKRKFQGEVVSAKMAQTAVVKVVTKKTDAKYKKSYAVTTKFKCHNPENKYQEGDRVIFEECRPLSKEKKWIIINKVK